MPEMPHSGEYHRQSGLICRRNYFIVAHGSAGLDNRRSTGFGSGQ
jgi:hypothetical protein